MSSNNKLTEKQKRFCDEYLIDLNATRSYKIAYPVTKSDNAAAVNANRLLRTTKISNYLGDKMNKRSERTHISQDETIENINKISRANICLLFKNAQRGANGTYKLCLKSLDEIPEDLQYAIASIKTMRDGTIEVKMCDKMKALELQARHQGMFRDNVEITGSVDVNSTNKLDAVIQQLKE